MRIITTILLCALFASCYNQRKADRAFHKSVLYYPNLASDYCAKAYPPDTATVFKQGDSILVTDTLYGAGEIDTVVSKDTVYITRTLPAKVITKTIIRTDTITVTKINTAALDACKTTLDKSIDLNKGLRNLLEKTIKEKEAAQHSSRSWFWRFIAACSALGLGIFLRLKRII